MPMPARTKTFESLQALNRGSLSWHTQPTTDAPMNQTLTTLNSLHSTRSAFAALPGISRTSSLDSDTILSKPDNTCTSKSQDVPDPCLNLPSVSTSITTSFHNTANHNDSSSPASSIAKGVSLKPHLLPSNAGIPDLAAHYGIPTVLPKAPTTAPRRMITHSAPAQMSCSPSSDSDSLRTKMLSQPASSATPSPVDTMAHTNYVAALSAEQLDAAKFLQDIIGDTASMFTSNGDDFLTGTSGTPSLDFGTSPFESPYNDFLNTPIFGDEPLLTDDFDGMNLFGGLDSGAVVEVASSEEDSASANILYTLSPVSLATGLVHLSTTSPYHSPPVPSKLSKLVSLGDRQPNGTRKNITPEKLVPIDAPTQPRQYRGPSATSRKEVPALFARKRNRSSAFGADDDDELELESLPANATVAEQIEHKRRHNTLAARKSRKRKLEYQQGLEQELVETRQLVEEWKRRAEIYEGVLKSRGLGGAVIAPV